MRGKLYGVGVGPGDPDLMTLRAKDVLEKCSVIAYPVRKLGEEGVALNIIKQRVDISGKEIAELLFSMDPDDEVRKKCRAEAMAKMCQMLDEGRDIAMVTLGDVAVYSTYMYIDREIRERGYETEVIPGIPSFCHGAALARLPLMIGEESLAVVSMAKHNLAKAEKALDSSDNIVLMKAFSSISDIAAMMRARGIPLDRATVMSNVGMADEYIGPLDPERSYGYFTTVLIKKGD
ncbi:MAG: precorrin-2 C(20)-methyltransferase [Candidatus Methanomethylophilus sp.]|jgi:precorrin-2/cobalt-factor-2 C20-methyltransferase|nr:precorrin-2 C(20)-methyltransferase [Methanomethylophilus sp.]MCI2074514.1 precorrin-2 C(20)-methyltransferase [Methanomethylophilus sp.]MCI2093773.1 precorrin-2 C(20)-methyltransferase [Methanomethylophilus sp.]MCI2093804.1 precorrin-2 C(20)-methyltransferase [Methanomethylophilus sp.]MEE3400968.1 precorrin-2 C(20)-methyltransferase [Methanomethylophilus sp.]